MENKIQIPEGKEIDYENSKIVFKNIKPKQK